MSNETFSRYPRHGVLGKSETPFVIEMGVELGFFRQNLKKEVESALSSQIPKSFAGREVASFESGVDFICPAQREIARI